MLAKSVCLILNIMAKVVSLLYMLKVSFSYMNSITSPLVCFITISCLVLCWCGVLMYSIRFGAIIFYLFLFVFVWDARLHLKC